MNVCLLVSAMKIEINAFFNEIITFCSLRNYSQVNQWCNSWMYRLQVGYFRLHRTNHKHELGNRHLLLSKKLSLIFAQLILLLLRNTCNIFQEILILLLHPSPFILSTIYSFITLLTKSPWNHLLRCNDPRLKPHVSHCASLQKGKYNSK